MRRAEGTGVGGLHASIRRHAALAPTGMAILVQASMPLLDQPTRLALVPISVVLMACAAIVHCWSSWGYVVTARVIAAAGLMSLVAEAVGVATGFPFGAYEYTADLGPRLAGVPLIVPLAWIMLAYPLVIAARLALSRHPRLVVPAATLGLVGWDFSLDPQMVDLGAWRWNDPDPHLPGLAGVPLTNLAGWVLVGLLVCSVLDRVIPRRPPPTVAGPMLVLVWTWLGSALALAAFWQRPGAAAYGFVVMAPVVLAALRAVPSLTRRPVATPEDQSAPARTSLRGSARDATARPRTDAGATQR